MKNPFAREVYVRLTEGGTNFVCTTKYGRFYRKSREVALNCPPAAEPADDKSLLPARRPYSYWASAWPLEDPEKQ